VAASLIVKVRAPRLGNRAYFAYRSAARRVQRRTERDLCTVLLGHPFRVQIQARGRFCPRVGRDRASWPQLRVARGPARHGFSLRPRFPPFAVQHLGVWPGPRCSRNRRSFASTPWCPRAHMPCGCSHQHRHRVPTTQGSCVAFRSTTGSAGGPQTRPSAVSLRCLRGEHRCAGVGAPRTPATGGRPWPSRESLGASALAAGARVELPRAHC